MTLRFIDGFDHYATADLQASKKWNSTGTASVISATDGRRGTGCWAHSSTGFDIYHINKTLDNQATYIVGFAMYITNLTATRFLEIIDGATVQFSLAVDVSGHILAYRGAGTTLLGTSTNTLSINTWNYIECKVTFDNSDGVVDIHVNGSGTGWISLTSQDTCATANEYASIIRIGTTANNYLRYRIDDLYICDTNGSVNNDFLGDVRVDSYLATGNGNHSDFTGSDSDSTDNYLLIDDTSPDGDTTYVQSATVGHIDTYGFADMTHTPASIFGVQIVMEAKKDDSGTRGIAGMVRQDSTDYAGSSRVVSTSYVDYMDIRETDPATATAWTKAGFNSAEFGIKVSE